MAGGGAPSSRPTRLRRTARLLVVGVVGLAVVVLFVLPGRTWLEQRSALTTTAHQLQVLDAENAKLRSTASSLDTDGEIERIARERYGLVMPGQQEYVVLPPAPGVPAGEVGPTSTTTVAGSSHTPTTAGRTATASTHGATSNSGVTHPTTTTTLRRSTTTTASRTGG